MVLLTLEATAVTGGAMEPGPEMRKPELAPPEGMTLDQWERTLLERALAESAGNQTRAAQRLGISRDTLRYRMKKHGLAGP